jgi:hypothetical protein
LSAWPPSRTRRPSRLALTFAPIWPSTPAEPLWLMSTDSARPNAPLLSCRTSEESQ